MEGGKSNRKPLVLAIGLFLFGLIIGGAVVGSYIGMNSISSVTVTAWNGNEPVLNVLATFFTLQDWAAVVGGSRADVSLIVPMGQDVHEFEPSPASIQAIAQANILVLNGVGLEPWVSSAIAAANNPHLVVVDCSKGINLITLPPQFQVGNRTVKKTPVCNLGLPLREAERTSIFVLWEKSIKVDICINH